MEKDSIVKLSFEFALNIIAFSKVLEEAEKFITVKQILKSGTSIGASIWKAQQTESRHDFIHKIKIAVKKMKETEYWLLFLSDSSQLPVRTIMDGKITKYSKND